MFKPKKPAKVAEDPVFSKVRLPSEEGLRSFAGIKELLNEAGARRGCPVELPWRTNKPGQIFVLTVQWDASTTDATWTFCEENENESTVLWSQAWSPSDLELMYDMIAMAAEAHGSAKAQIPDNLKPESEKQAEEGSRANNQYGARPTDDIKPGLAPAPPINPYPPQPQPYPYGYPTPMPYPMPYPSPPGYPPLPTAPAGYPAAPPAYPPQQTQQTFPQQANQISGNWQYASAPSPPAAPAQAAPVMPASKAGAEPSQGLPVDLELLAKCANIQLGTLLTSADLITEPTLEAALKVQDLVRVGKLSSERAPAVLKLFFSMGAAIEDYIDSADLSSSPASQGKTVKSAEAPDKKIIRQTFELLIDSGLLSTADFKTAHAVQEKHGGNIVDILQAAGKLDRQTMSVATICASLVRAGSMKIEQCIIALNYCNRSRVGFDEAMAELHWENPRISTKNL